ncbi:MAG TPA: HAD family hydrolase [Pyrinomonadaceae bacterium]|nr:HAD family hydrolase [Pyrinomonadaceae bacterium]
MDNHSSSAVANDEFLCSLKRRLVSCKAFIFDFYGTLVEMDYEPPQMWETLTKMGYQSHPELQATFEADGFDGCLTPSSFSSPNYEEWKRDNLRQFVMLCGVPRELVETVISRLLEIESQATKKAAPGAISLLKLLRSYDKKIGLCSNWDFGIQPFLDQAGLPEFDAITVSAEIGARKPHILMFRDICAKLEIQPDEAAFIGDNWAADVRGALRAGLLPVWIRHDQLPGPLNNQVIEFDSLVDFEAECEKIFSSEQSLTRV